MRILFFILIAFTFSACSKYDEGKASLASKKSRLVNDWVIVSLTSNGFDITATKAITKLDVKSNNTFTVYSELFGIPTSSNAIWAFNSKKTHVLVTNGNGTVDSYEIIKLEKDSIKLKIINDNGETIVHEYKSA